MKMNSQLNYEYHVTGILYNGKRFKLVYGGENGYYTAVSINLFNGSVWRVDKQTGKRKCIKRVIN